MNPPQTPDSLAATVGRIAAVLGSEHFPTGDRAALRRMIPGQPVPLTFYRFALRYLPNEWDSNRDTCNDWLTLVAGIALMSPNAHHPERRLGTALGETGYAEARLERLLAVKGNTRRILLLRAARFLAAKSSPCNWVDAAQLLLTRRIDKLENLHRRIARDYYAALENKER